MAFSIEEMKGELRYGGALPHLFKVIMSNPVLAIDVDDKFQFMCHSASLPPTAIGSTEIDYFGRQFNIPGKQKYVPWRIDVYNDEDFKIKNAFEYWASVINSHESNLRAPGFTNPNSVKTDALVYQYGKEGGIIKKVQMVGLFPTSVGEIQLSWKDGGAIETFTVELAVDYWDTAEIL